LPASAPTSHLRVVNMSAPLSPGAIC